MSDAAKGRPDLGTIELERHEPDAALASPIVPTDPPAAAKLPPAASIPIRRRAMPCPHCDAELSSSLAADPDARCPACGLALAPVEIAGFWRRSGAGMADFALLLITAGPLAWGLDRLIDPAPLTEGASGIDRWLTLFSTDFSIVLGRLGPFLVMFALYYVVMLALNGQTVGQRLLAMRVVDRNGHRPSVAIAGLRSVAQIAGLLVAALGLLWIAFDAERRGFHDHVAGTFVVRST